MKIYFDACVLIAGLLSPNGGSALLLTFVKQKRVTGISSQTVLEEILNKTKKIKKSKQEIEQWVQASGLLIRKGLTGKDIIEYGKIVDLDDAHVIAGAMLTKCQYLVTLDKKHLLRKDIKEHFASLSIVSPKELLELIVTRK